MVTVRAPLTSLHLTALYLCSLGRERLNVTSAFLISFPVALWEGKAWNSYQWHQIQGLLCHCTFKLTKQPRLSLLLPLLLSLPLDSFPSHSKLSWPDIPFAWFPSRAEHPCSALPTAGILLCSSLMMGLHQWKRKMEGKLNMCISLLKIHMAPYNVPFFLFCKSVFPHISKLFSSPPSCSSSCFSHLLKIPSHSLFSLTCSVVLGECGWVHQVICLILFVPSYHISHHH